MLLAGWDAALERALREVLTAYHSRAVLIGALPGKLGIAPELLRRLLSMLGDVFASPAIFAELAIPGFRRRTSPRAYRSNRDGWAQVDQQPGFDAATLDLVSARRATFGITDFDRVPLTAVRRVELFRALTQPFIDRGETRPDLAGMIIRYAEATGFDAVDLERLAELLGCDVPLLRSYRTNCHARIRRSPLSSSCWWPW